MSRRYQAAKRDRPRPGKSAPAARSGGVRLGLCCQFAAEPIEFRTTTAAALRRKTRREQLRHLADLCAANADSLLTALQLCTAHGGGGSREVESKARALALARLQAYLDSAE